MRGIIVKGVGGLYTVKVNDEFIECRARGLFRKAKMVPLVGDYVVVEDSMIVNIEERKNALIRPPCANIDKLFIVAAVAEPDPVVYNIDKLTAIATYHKIKPILIFSKSDLEDRKNLCGLYENLPILQFCVSVQKDCSIVLDLLRQEIAGNTIALCGLSGVGKSTLLNLIGGLDLQTGQISQKLRRGRHTTRNVELFDICGGYIMDTPGFSNLELAYFNIKDRSLLADCFPEFSLYGSCRFSDCSHTGEPGCAVMEAVKNGEIPVSRWENYKKLFTELGVYKEWENREKRG